MKLVTPLVITAFLGTLSITLSTPQIIMADEPEAAATQDQKDQDAEKKDCECEKCKCKKGEHKKCEQCKLHRKHKKH